MRLRSKVTLFTVLLIMLGLSSSAAWSTWQRRNLIQDGSDYAVNITLQTLGSASASALLAVADPRFLKGWDEDGVQRYIDLIAARLGPIEGLSVTGGGIDALPLPFINQEIEARYTMQLRFPEATATAEIILAHRSRLWRLLDFQVDSPLISD